jgi:2-phosphosulfolactate phosphatase
MELPRLEVCFSPALLHLYDTKNTIVVIIDIFRATSTIVTALDNGANSIIPVASVEECIALGKAIPNSITAGERDGKVAQGLQNGNSPLEYPKEFITNKKLILTTTNGTRLLHMVKESHAIVIGSFLNLQAICNYLVRQNKNVLLGCAAWKDRVNIEDALFAGAVVNNIKQHFSLNCDSARMANHLYVSSQGKLLDFLKDSSHYKRLSGFGLQKDMEYCTTPNQHPIVPVLVDKELVIHS